LLSATIFVKTLRSPYTFLMHGGVSVLAKRRRKEINHVQPDERHVGCRSHRSVGRERRHASDGGRAARFNAESAG
jgi:hypothetical protein